MIISDHHVIKTKYQTKPRDSIDNIATRSQPLIMHKLKQPAEFSVAETLAEESRTLPPLMSTCVVSIQSLLRNVLKNFESPTTCYLSCINLKTSSMCLHLHDKSRQHFLDRYRHTAPRPLLSHFLSSIRSDPFISTNLPSPTIPPPPLPKKTNLLFFSSTASMKK